MRYTRSDDPGGQAWPMMGPAMDGWTPAGRWPAPHLPRPLAPRLGAGAISECLVDESAAQSIRQLCRPQAAAPGDTGAAHICLLDPSRLWASQVVHALAHEQGAQPERVDLRERGSLRTLAVIERTRAPARRALGLGDDDTPAVLVSSLAYGLDQIGNVAALAESSHLATVVVGGMQTHALDNLLQGLLAASRSPLWRCPQLLFILPPAAADLEHGILAQSWPAKLRITVVAEAPDSPRAAWQCVLDAWWGQAALAAPLAADVLPPGAASPTWQQLARAQGVLASGLARLDDGHLIEQWLAEGEHLAQALRQHCAALCQALRAHALAEGPEARQTPDEILVSHGRTQTLLRPLPGHPGLAWVAQLDPDLVNLTTIRRHLSATGLY